MRCKGYELFGLAQRKPQSSGEAERLLNSQTSEQEIVLHEEEHQDEKDEERSHR